MTIECPICGKEVAFSQYSYDEEMCNHCLANEVEEKDIAIDKETLEKYTI